MGVVTEHLIHLLSKELTNHGIVVWYDPEQHYTKFIGGSVELEHSHIARFTDGFFALRQETEPFLSGPDPGRLVVYLPAVEAYIQSLLESLVGESPSDSREQLNPVDDRLKTGSGTDDASGPTPRIVGKASPAKDRSREQAWLAAHRDQYAGRWVALDGDRLLAHGPNLKRVADAAHHAGAEDALIARAEADGAPPCVGM